MTADPLFRARSRVATAVRQRDPVAERNARRDLNAARLARRIQEALNATPALTPDQRATLARMLATREDTPDGPPPHLY